MVSAFARIYLIGCIGGTLAILILTLILEGAGYSPHIRWMCPYETYTLVKILARGSSVLCLVVAAVTLVRAYRQFFVAPRRAVRPLVKVAFVLVAAFVLPNFFGVLSESALGPRPFAAAVRADVASAPHMVL